LFEIADYEGYYQTQIGEQIAYRYLINDIVDKGAFGQVVRCFDLKQNGVEVALKISRNKKQDLENALVEIKILQLLNKNDKYN
jgi:dual specificity tyrosine-phosphorylation-regulated kinase 2/3/4